MIELQRAKMGIPTTSTTTHQNGTGSSSTTPNNSDQPNAIASIRANQQDERLHTFLSKLQHTKPTVPPSLTRRILNKQGVGFQDPLVSTVVSCAADRFLATVLSQALVCRDRRLKGEELARKEKREIERVRKRRRAEQLKTTNKKQKLEKELEDFVKKGQKSPQKQDKKGSSELIKRLETNSFGKYGERDSLDEEEDYYLKIQDESQNKNGPDALDNSVQKDIETGNQSYEEDESDEDEDEDDDDEREILQMRDLVRPLEAWGFALTGKMGLATEPYIRTPKEKTNENDDDNVGLDGEVDAAEVDEEDDDATSAVEKTPSRKRKVGPKGSPASNKRDGIISPIPGKSTSSAP